MTIAAQIKLAATDALAALYPDAAVDWSLLLVNVTKPEFAGDYTVVLFPYVKALRVKPDVLGRAVGEHLLRHAPMVSGYETVGGFLNLTISDRVWIGFLQNHVADAQFGASPKVDRRVMVEYSSPNTNKPLHFGHLRNNFLGYAVAEMLKATGNQVVKANLVNDRGIHICKSMLAWQLYGEGQTPESTGVKGDHLVGAYYVRFNDAYKAQVRGLVAQGKSEAEAEAEAPILFATQEMLRQWEAGDPEVRGLWQRMNSWVLAGFETTYRRLGIDFDRLYFESDTYLLGKQIVESGLRRNLLYRRENGSIWIDLTEHGLDHKLLLRADGTSVYITQDLGTAKLKYDEYRLDQSIYVIADEQNYHMEVLRLVLQRLQEPCAAGIFHLSYGMVELPTGRMKSREGTVVDADDMIDEMIRLAREQTESAGKTGGFSEAELEQLYETIGIGALKFYLLRVEPRKKMIFDPQESIDLHGFTATFIQYAHARICSILRKERFPIRPDASRFQAFVANEALLKEERELVKLIEQYPDILQTGATEMAPSVLCNYAFRLAQEFNTFYDRCSIAHAENEEKKDLRLMLIIMAASVMRHCMGLLGIQLPERM